MSHRPFPCYSSIKQERNKQFQSLFIILTWELQNIPYNPAWITCYIMAYLTLTHYYFFYGKSYASQWDNTGPTGTIQTVRSA
jgi:hypothetical protein